MIWNKRDNSPPWLRRGAAKRRGGSFKEIDRLNNTTPALRATPPQLRRGVFAIPALMLATAMLYGQVQKPAAPVAVNCSYLKAPEEFQYSPDRDHIEITNRANEFSNETFRAVIDRRPDSKAAVERRNIIDDHIFGRMEAAGIRPAPSISDVEFLRRVSLDVTGRIPSIDEIEKFANDSNPSKRDRLIDSLIDSPEFIDKWTMFLGDLLKVNSVSSNIVLYQQGRDAMFAYVRDAVGRNKPYDQIATELITATGNNLFQGAANWVVSATVVDGPPQDTYDSQAVTAASQFLGINTVDCLLCHDGARRLNTLNLWASRRTRLEMWGLSAFFADTHMERSVASSATVVFKSVVKDVPSEYWLYTRSGNRVARQFIDHLYYAGPVYPFTGQSPEPAERRREALARFITQDPQFARAFVNYVWEKLMVVAFVTPSNAFDPARLDPDNPPQAPWTLQPTNPELLNALGRWFSENGYDLRKLIALITKSNAYQLSSDYPYDWKPAYVPYYARHYPRRLDAEEIHDAIVKATGVVPNYVLDYAGSLNPLPPVNWAMQLPDPREPRSNNNVAQFLNSLGRGDRDLVPRAKDGSVAMTLSLMNNNFVMQRIHANNNGSTVQRLLASNLEPAAIARHLFAATLSRAATESELQAALDTMRQLGATRGAEALQWALLNKLEFIHNY